jgi:hypothetical protein
MKNLLKNDEFLRDIENAIDFGVDEDYYCDEDGEEFMKQRFDTDVSFRKVVEVLKKWIV